MVSVLARTTTPVTGSPFETAPGIARAFAMGKVAFPEAGEADSGPASKRRLDYPSPVTGRLALHAAAWTYRRTYSRQCRDTC